MTTETSGYRSKDKGIKTIYVPLKDFKARYCGCLSDNCARQRLIRRKRKKKTFYD